jgi:hypothetical protein
MQKVCVDVLPCSCRAAVPFTSLAARGNRVETAEERVVTSASNHHCYHPEASDSNANSVTKNMTESQEDVQMETEEIEQETPHSDVFMAPSISKSDILAGKSYSHFSPIPKQIADDMSGEVVLGVDEAGRGPVLGTTHPFQSNRSN